MIPDTLQQVLSHLHPYQRHPWLPRSPFLTCTASFQQPGLGEGEWEGEWSGCLSERGLALTKFPWSFSSQESGCRGEASSHGGSPADSLGMADCLGFQPSLPCNGLSSCPSLLVYKPALLALTHHAKKASSVSRTSEPHLSPGLGQ